MHCMLHLSHVLSSHHKKTLARCYPCPSSVKNYGTGETDGPDVKIIRRMMIMTMIMIRIVQESGEKTIERLRIKNSSALIE